jgi:hypothetical protein
MSIKLPPIPTALTFDSDWVNWIFKLYERQKTFLNVTKEPEVAAATPSTHKVEVTINGKKYYILLEEV